MRLAFVSLMGGLPWGGSEVLWYRTTQLALQQGHHVMVSVYNWGKQNAPQLSELKEQGALLHVRRKWDVGESLLKKVKRKLGEQYHSLSENWKELISFKPDEVFISQGDNFDLVIHHAELYKILKNNKISYSFICHNNAQYSQYLEYKQYLLAREVFANAKKVWFVSHRQWQLTERKICMRLENAGFTWNPLNLNEYNCLPWPPMEVVQLAVVGNLISGKGHDTLFEVLSDEKWKQRTWQLNIYGQGDGEKYLKDLCNFYQLEGTIVFKGFVSSAIEIWEQNHLLLIPSAGEGLPISLVEAAICGRPAVVTDVGGNSQIIEDNVTGFVACAPTVGSFADALEKAWENRWRLHEMGKKLYEFISEIINLEPEKALCYQLTKKKDEDN